MSQPPARTPSALGPDARDDAIAAMSTEGELDVLVVGGGIVGVGTALDAVTRGLNTGLLEQRDLASGTSSRSSKLIHGGLRYLEMLDFGLVREALQERGLLLTRLAPAPGPSGAVPLPADPPRLGAPLRRRRARALRRDGDDGEVRHGGAAPPPPLQAPDRPDRAGLQVRVGRGRDPVLRLPGRRRTAGGDDRAHGRWPRRPRRDPGEGDRLPQGGRARGRRARPRPGPGPRLRGPRPRRGQRGRGLDRRDPADGRRPRCAARAGQQGHPPGRAARPDPFGGRLHRPHRDLGAVRDPVGPALDHRHHRHPVGSRQGAPRGQQGRHRLHPRPRQQDPARAARPRRRRGRVRRTATACSPASPSRLRGSRASTPW